MKAIASYIKTHFSPVYGFLLVSILTFFAFGLYHLTHFVTADEHYWLYERIPQYWHAIDDHVWKKTLINDKPGVSVALVSGIGLFFEPHPETHVIKNTEKLDLYDTDRTEHLALAFRLPLLLFNTIFLAYFFFIVAKLTHNRWIATWTVMGIALSPVLIGISQIVNPDTLLWTFGSGAFFTYLVALHHPEKKYVVLTAILLGFAILSKYTATIFYPFFLLLLLLRLFFLKKTASRQEIQAATTRFIINYAAIIIGSILMICLFVPAVIVRPHNLWEILVGFSSILPWIYGLIGLVLLFLLIDARLAHGYLLQKIRRYGKKPFSILLRCMAVVTAGIFALIVTSHTISTPWQLFTVVPFDIKDTTYFLDFSYIPNFFEIILLNFRPLVFSLPPILLLIIIGLSIHFSCSRKHNILSFSTIAGIIFIDVFLTANAATGVITSIRYSILLYPIIALLSAIGLWYLAKRFFPVTKGYLLLSVLFYCILGMSVWISKPFYFNYTNDLLSKDLLITDSWGYGGYEAAQYINAQSNPENLIVWSDYYGVCEFIKGTCITNYKYPATGKYATIDYYVTTRRGKIRYNPEHARWRAPDIIHPYRYYDQPDPVWELTIDGRPGNYIRIYQSY